MLQKNKNYTHYDYSNIKMHIQEIEAMHLQNDETCAILEQRNIDLNSGSDQNTECLEN